MKRVSAIICLVVLLVAVLGPAVYADSDTYSIPELDMQVDIPSQFYVITRNSTENDSVFTDLNLSYNTVMTYCQQNNIYLDAVVADLQEELVITMTESQISDFNALSDASLEYMTEVMIEEIESHGVTMLNYEICANDQVKFVKMYTQYTAQSAYSLTYYTTVDFKAINFTLQSHAGQITDTQEAYMDTIIKSVRFGSDTITGVTEPENATTPGATTPSDGATENGDSDWAGIVLPTTDVPDYTIQVDPGSVVFPTQSFDIDLNTNRLDADVYNYTYNSGNTAIIASLIGIALWALIPGFIARNKGRSFWAYYFLSFLISPLITIIIAACRSNLNAVYEGSVTNTEGYTSTAATSWECRLCGTVNDANYGQCKKCGAHNARKKPASTPAVADAWVCGNCGTQNSMNFSQCKKCGKFKT